MNLLFRTPCFYFSMKIFPLSFIWMWTLCDSKLHITSFHIPSHPSPSDTESSLTIKLTEMLTNRAGTSFYGIMLSSITNQSLSMYFRLNKITKSFSKQEVYCLLFRVNVLKHLLDFGSQNPNKNQYGNII